MNPKTGEIKELNTDEEALEAMKDGWIKLDKRPNPGCRHCHGRGHLGKNLSTNTYIPCRCVKKRNKTKGAHG